LFVRRHFEDFTRRNAGSKREYAGSEKDWRLIRIEANPPLQRYGAAKRSMPTPTSSARRRMQKSQRTQGFIRGSPEPLSATSRLMPVWLGPVHLVIPNSRLSVEQTIYRIDIMKITKNIGMLLLAVYLIIDGLLGFGLNIGPAIFLLYIVALAAGVFILIGK
jgi:hypothetical protein